jgi:ribosomal protein S18 acetylase RimI-like enzyme
MPTKPQFRIAVESDAELLLGFMQSYYAYDGHGFDREKARVALVSLLRNPEFGRAWLILDGDSPVGYVVICLGYSLEWLGRDAFVDELYLREEYRGHGWGENTMAFLETAAQELGVRALHLEVIHGNDGAMNLYRKLGFQAHASTFLSKWIEMGFTKPASQKRQQTGG